jgi:predicted AlkP superfamily phosphohydrolase/phosphomutase
MTVLAIALDAAEGTLIRRLIAAGELPVLGELTRSSRWCRLHGSAPIGSDSVWPTFHTGRPPSEHGYCTEWWWDANRMDVGRPARDPLRPFWADVDDLSIGVFDVPRAEHLSLAGGFEVTDWGAHESLGRPRISPASARALVPDTHPLSRPHYLAREPTSVQEFSSYARTCIRGATLRSRFAADLLRTTAPDLAIVVFSEIHFSSHRLWHTVEPDDALYGDLREAAAAISPNLLDLYRHVDSQLAPLLDALRPRSRVFVFALHGMRATRGRVRILRELLIDWGFAVPAEAARYPRPRPLVAGLKRRVPVPLKRAWYRLASRNLVDGVAALNLLGPYDWECTRAFALPADENGLLRVNLRGREARGIVEPADYGPLLDELEGRLRDLADARGRPLVARVIRPDRPAGHGGPLPDLIVHWTKAAFDVDLRLTPDGPRVPPIDRHLTGRHSLEGFCLAPPSAVGDSDELELAELHRLFLSTARGLRGSGAGRTIREPRDEPASPSEPASSLRPPGAGVEVANGESQAP